MNPRIVVLAPAPLVTVTIEQSPAGDEIHFHAGGQGVWIARLVASLGVDVTLCASFGGESGVVIQALLESWGIEVHPVEALGWNGAYIHDRRSGERLELAEMVESHRSRHEIDELYGATLVAGLEADLVVLGGPERTTLDRTPAPQRMPLDIYTRLARDLRSNGIRVIADLSGPVLDATLLGGIDVLKVSDEELRLHGEVDDTSPDALSDAMLRLRKQGAEAIVITRAERPTLALLDGTAYAVRPPAVDPIDTRGGGDSVTAGIAAGLARGLDLVEAVRLGAAAGALNVTRRGFASGSRQEIETLAGHVEMQELDRR
jgi:1-phosphofructokinase